jgi:hypothetical protein
VADVPSLTPPHEKKKRKNYYMAFRQYTILVTAKERVGMKRCIQQITNAIAAKQFVSLSVVK